MDKRTLIILSVIILSLLFVMPSVSAGWFQDWFSISAGRKIVVWPTTPAACSAANCAQFETNPGSGVYEYYNGCTYDTTAGTCVCTIQSATKPATCGGNVCAYTVCPSTSWSPCVGSSQYCQESNCNSLTRSCTPATCASLGYLSSPISGQTCTSHSTTAGTCYSCIAPACAYTTSTCPTSSWSVCSNMGTQYCTEANCNSLIKNCTITCPTASTCPSTSWSDCVSDRSSSSGGSQYCFPCMNVTRPCNPPDACAKLGYLWAPPSSDVTCEKVIISANVLVATVCYTNCVSNTNGTNETNTNGTNETPIYTENSLSMTKAAFDTATNEQISLAMCDLGHQCSKTNILADESVNVEDYNWTISCVKSAAIYDENKLAFGNYLTQQAQAGGWFTSFSGFFDKLFRTASASDYNTFCQNNYNRGILSTITKWIIGSAGPDECAQLLTTMPQGTCRATVKASSAGVCWQQANTWLSPLTGINDCQTNTIILVVGGFIIFLVLMKMIK